MNSGEKLAITAAGTPSTSSPSAVNATCSAVDGGGSCTRAVAIGAARSQDRAADADFTRTSA